MEDKRFNQRKMSDSLLDSRSLAVIEKQCPKLPKTSPNNKSSNNCLWNQLVWCWMRLTRSPLAGVYCAFLASIASPLTYLTAAMVTDASPVTVFLVRSLQHISVFGVLVARDEEWDTFFPSGELTLLLIRAVFQSCSLVTCYVALTLLPTADVYAVASSYPLFATVGGYLFLKERFGWTQGVGALATVIGAIFVCRPEFMFGPMEPYISPEVVNANATMIENIQEMASRLQHPSSEASWTGTLLSALSCIFQAAAILLSRKIRRSTTATVMVYSGSVAAAGAAIYVIAADDWRFPRCGTQALLVIGGGATSMLTNALTFYAGTLIKAGRLSVIRSSSILFTYLLQVLLMGVIPQWHSLVGGALILMSLLLTTVKIKKPPNQWCQKSTTSIEEIKTPEVPLPVGKSERIELDQLVDNKLNETQTRVSNC